MVTVSELMTKKLVTVSAGTSAADAARIMNERHVGSVFIEQNDRVIGIVTESDIVRKVVGENKPVHFVPVEAIMSSPVISLDERRSISAAAELMQHHHTRHLGVLQSGAIVGVLSVRDLLHPVAVDEF